MTRLCVHGRTERQKCALCRLRSSCCGDTVQQVKHRRSKYYVCDRCGLRCKVVK